MFTRSFSATELAAQLKGWLENVPDIEYARPARAIIAPYVVIGTCFLVLTFSLTKKKDTQGIRTADPPLRTLTSTSTRVHGKS